MTKIEAIKILWQYDVNFEPHPTEDVMHAIDMAIEALEQEPKRGRWIGEADGYSNGELVYDIWSCGNCGTHFDEWEEEPTWNYCPCCGTRMESDI